MPLLDSIIVFLLIIGIIIALKLYKRLQKLKGVSDNVSHFLKQLGYYTQQISGHVSSLKRTTDDGALNQQLPDMFALRDDFDVLLEHGEKLAKRLDSIIDRAQDVEQSLKQMLESVHPYPSSQSKTSQQQDVHERYQSGSSLLSALKGVR